jgi:hypothetical protein
MPAQRDDALDQLIRDLPTHLEALRSSVQQQQPELLPLDLSYESLDRVEDHYRAVLDSKVGADELKALRDRISLYVGATLIERVGGSWAVHREVPTSPEPAVADVPLVKHACFLPLEPVQNFKRLRAPGLLRDVTERWDLARRREQLAAHLARLEAEVAGLRADVEELTGQQVELREGDARSLQALQDALQKLVGSDPPREVRRRVRTRAVLLLGTLLRQALDKVEWTVNDNPKHADFGQFVIAGWAPSNAIRMIGPKIKPDHLRAVLADQIATRRKQ